MAGLRELKKHLKSVRTTGQLAGAMKTVSTAKYSRINAVLSNYREYASACDALLSQCGFMLSKTREPTSPRPVLLVVVSGNRGLCGGFNSDVLTRFLEEKENTKESVVVTVGKKASEYCREKGIVAEREFSVPDIPDYEVSRRLAEYVLTRFQNGEVSAVRFVYQGFKNMLTQTPTVREVLPQPHGAEEQKEGILLEPCRDIVWETVIRECFPSKIHSVLLESAAGAQAATIMAMRSAFDNAKENASKLEITINRRRQTEVTAGVLETATENRQ